MQLAAELAQACWPKTILHSSCTSRVWLAQVQFWVTGGQECGRHWVCREAFWPGEGWWWSWAVASQHSYTSIAAIPASVSQTEGVGLDPKRKLEEFNTNAYLTFQAFTVNCDCAIILAHCKFALVNYETEMRRCH